MLKPEDTDYKIHGDSITVRADCIEYMKTLATQSVDAVISDPPYNVGIFSDDDKPDYEEWSTRWWEEALRIAKCTIFTCGIGNLKFWMQKDPRWVVAWVKRNSMRRITIGFNCWEPLLVWGTPELNIYRDIIEVPIVPHKDVEHPTPKPVHLYTAIIEAFTKPNALVLDPFMGSGTTGIACVVSGRRFIGVEIDEAYYTEANQRIEEAGKQIRLGI